MCGGVFQLSAVEGVEVFGDNATVEKLLYLVVTSLNEGFRRL